MSFSFIALLVFLTLALAFVVGRGFLMLAEIINKATDEILAELRRIK